MTFECLRLGKIYFSGFKCSLENNGSEIFEITDENKFDGIILNVRAVSHIPGN